MPKSKKRSAQQGSEKILTPSIKHQIFNVFEHIHAHPELSWQEYKTTEYLAKMLRELGCQVRTFKDQTGLIAEIGSGKPVIGLRADLDALWQELDGVFQANHSCGHDGHASMAVGALLMLKENLPKQGTIRFIFQPAEEKGTGAIAMMEQGALDDLTHLYGVHLRPIDELPMGKASACIRHGASCWIKGRIKGTPAHAARPHQGVNVIEVASALVQALGQIHLNPTIPFSVKMTRFKAGSQHNVIPDAGRFSLDLRAQTNEQMDTLINQVTNIMKRVGQQFNAKIKYKQQHTIVAAVPHPEAVSHLGNAISQVLGPENLVNPAPTPGAEDFHFYGYLNPHLKTTLLGLGCDLSPGLHHPLMTFNREALNHGALILASAILNTFAALEENREPE